jgi:hypothetical protein
MKEKRREEKRKRREIGGRFIDQINCSLSEVSPQALL